MGIKEKLENLYDKTGIGVWGLLGGGIILMVSIISSIGYVGREGEIYNYLNHMVSELGESGVNPTALLFNIGLIIGGFISVFFMIGLGLRIKNKIAKVGMVIGSITVIFGGLVGAATMNFTIPHIIASTGFFIGGLFTVAMFSIAIIIQKESKIPKLFALLGLIVIALFTTFIIVATNIDIAGYDLIDMLSGNFVRPEVWLVPIFEWASLFSILTWIILISIYDLLGENK